MALKICRSISQEFWGRSDDDQFTGARVSASDQMMLCQFLDMMHAFLGQRQYGHLTNLA